MCYRAKIQLENKKGQTALDIARAYADPRITYMVQTRANQLPPIDKRKRKGNFVVHRKVVLKFTFEINREIYLHFYIFYCLELSI